MAGLIEKDLRLIYLNKRMLMIFAVAFAIGVTKQGFILWYMPFVSMFASFGCTAYDETENGMAFLLTLPIERKTYVLEKYVLCAVSFLVSIALGEVMDVGVSIFRGRKVMFLTTEIAIIWDVLLIILSVMLPITLKFGREKSQMVLMAMAGTVALIGFLFASDAGKPVLDKIQGIALHITMTQIRVIGIMVACAALLISYMVSRGIMERKEL